MTLPEGALVRIYSPFDPSPVTEGAFRVIADQKQALEQLGFKVELRHWKERDQSESWPVRIRRGAGFLLTEDTSPELYYYPTALRERMQAGGARAALEIFHYSFAHAWLRRTPRATEGTRRAVHFHNLESDLSELRARTSDPMSSLLHRLNARRMRRHEAALASLCDEQWFVSRTDLRGYAAQTAEAHARLVTPGFDRALGEKRRACFAEAGRAGRLGGVPRLGLLGRYDFEPNRASLEWVVEKLAPALKTQEFSGKIEILGKGVPEALKAKAAAFGFFEFAGFVEDIEAFWLGWSHSLVPHVTGSGVRIKLLESLACGVPVLANPEAVAPVADELHSSVLVLPLENPGEWARAICSEPPYARRAALSAQPFPNTLDLREIYRFLT